MDLVRFLGNMKVALDRVQDEVVPYPDSAYWTLAKSNEEFAVKNQIEKLARIVAKKIFELKGGSDGEENVIDAAEECRPLK